MEIYQNCVIFHFEEPLAIANGFEFDRIRNIVKMMKKLNVCGVLPISIINWKKRTRLIVSDEMTIERLWGQKKGPVWKWSEFIKGQFFYEWEWEQVLAILFKFQWTPKYQPFYKNDERSISCNEYFHFVYTCNVDYLLLAQLPVCTHLLHSTLAV